MASKRRSKDQVNPIDKKILKTIYEVKNTNLGVISKRVGLSKSTVYNRLKRLKNLGIITGEIVALDQKFVETYMTAVSLIKAKYGPEYAEEVGKRIAKIKGVWAIYFVIGTNDFVALIRTKTKEELERIVNELSKTEGVERSETTIVLKMLKEDLAESMRLLVEE